MKSDYMGRQNRRSFLSIAGKGLGLAALRSATIGSLLKIPPENLNEIADAFERGITSRTRLILISHQVNITGQIMPVKAVCDIARAKGIETLVDGAHSFAQIDFKQKDLGCDYFGTSLHKWLYAPKAGLLYV